MKLTKKKKNQETQILIPTAKAFTSSIALSRSSAMAVKKKQIKNLGEEQR